jgi:hypothetical protein
VLAALSTICGPRCDAVMNHPASLLIASLLIASLLIASLLIASLLIIYGHYDDMTTDSNQTPSAPATLGPTRLECPKWPPRRHPNRNSPRQRAVAARLLVLALRSSGHDLGA